MNQCNQDCNQGRNCDCELRKLKEQQAKMDKYLKWLLLFATLYFLGHMVSAIAQSNPNPPIIRCIPAGNGTVTCFPI